MESHSEAVNQDSSARKNLLDDLSRDELIVKCKALLAIAQKAKQAKSELQNEVESFKLQLEKCESEKKANSDSLLTLQELVDSLTEQKLNYITEVDSAKGKIKALNEKCKKYEEELNRFRADVIVRDKQLAETTQNLSDLDSEIISLKRQNNRLIEENEQLINQLSELEAQTLEFNNIGLEQRKQLQLLEDKVQTEEALKSEISSLNKRIADLENELQIASNKESGNTVEFENKIKEVTQLYESEKNKKEKANIKLRSYKDKILKCAACITQLKNSRFILTKTVKEYSENIPKWQNDIMKASSTLDEQMKELNNENLILKNKLESLEKQMDTDNNNSKITELSLTNSTLLEKINDLEQSNNLATDEINKLNFLNVNLNDDRTSLQSQLSDVKLQLAHATKDIQTLRSELDRLKAKYEDLLNIELAAHINQKNQLNVKLNELKQTHNSLIHKNNELSLLLEKLKSENQILNNSLVNSPNSMEAIEHLNLQIKALESEKSMLVKEKLNARDNVTDLEQRNKMLVDQIDKLKLNLQDNRAQLDSLMEEKNIMEKSLKSEKESETNNLRCKQLALQEQLDLLKKEHDNLQDLNGLLKEEVETLKLSLEQPRTDDTESGSDLNVSLQADIVKLETKLSAYKQENASLLAEIKESRVKVKEFNSLTAECEDAKSKLLGYKTENSELLNEMKEINQVLKERGESISKLQKAIAELERLVETLEKDRDVINQEKDDLLNKVTTLQNDLQNAEQNTNKKSEVVNHILVEKDNAVKALVEKDSIIAFLKEEIERLKHQQSSSAELPNDDMSTSTISKAEEHSRMKDLDESFEEKYTKLRIFALKLKKKLNETVNQLQNAEQDKTKLEKLLEGEKTVLPTSTDEVDNCKVSELSNLQAKVKTLSATVEASENVAAELEKLKAELESKNRELAAEYEAHKATKDNLEKARRDAKKKNVLSLEMEDYERSMKELTTKMEEKKKKMVQMESIIDTQEGTITAMKTQIKLLEEQIRSEETQNRLTKEELQHAIEEGKEKDSVIQTKNAVILKLEQDLEEEKRKNEESDVETTSVLSEKEKIIMCLGEEKSELNNKVKRLEFKCSELNETLRITNIELADLKTEYTSYRVRAQAVLRQNQTVDHSQEEQLKEEAAALRAQIEALTAKLTTTQEQCASVSDEAESARRRAAEASGEATRAQQRTARLQADLARLSHQLDAERSQHNLQISTLTQCYKTQISELEVKLQKETDSLKQQLAAAQENAKISPSPLRMDEANHNLYMVPVIPKEEGSDGEMDINVSMIPREEGEGSESAPSPPPSKPYLTSAGSGRSPVPLERLLEEGVPDDEALDTSSLALTPEQEIADLRRRLTAQQQRVKHVTVLLSESERECARMSQLSELLKHELRRLQGSTHAAHNAEYMKHVTLKFLTLPPGDERSRLVPVLQKILTLTPDETNRVHAVAKGMDPNPSKGWGSYLPWPGGK